MSTIAETIVHYLAAKGIQRIWGVPDDSPHLDIPASFDAPGV